jgi:hypothetical protein
VEVGAADMGSGVGGRARACGQWSGEKGETGGCGGVRGRGGGRNLWRIWLDRARGAGSTSAAILPSNLFSILVF